MQPQCDCRVDRVRCKRCGRFFDLYSKAWHSQKTCPFCGVYDRFTVVPDWYGRPIPGWLENIWGEGEKKDTVFIPEHYLEVHIWLMGLDGRQITKIDALTYFRERARKQWGRKIEVMPNKEWSEKRGIHGHI